MLDGTRCAVIVGMPNRAIFPLLILAVTSSACVPDSEARADIGPDTAQDAAVDYGLGVTISPDHRGYCCPVAESLGDPCGCGIALGGFVSNPDMCGDAGGCDVGYARGGTDSHGCEILVHPAGACCLCFDAGVETDGAPADSADGALGDPDAGGAPDSGDAGVTD